MENPAQRSDEWFLKRLGKFTGSQVGLLMTNSRKKDEIFGDTAMDYIYQVASERDLMDCYKTVGDEFSIYREQTEISTKAMQWGTEQEDFAREIYEKTTGNILVEVSSCVCKEFPYFASSPDGYYAGDDGDNGCIEIKVPNAKTFYKYMNEVYDNNSLKSVKPLYYYQCLSHIICTHANWCDFTVFNPFAKHPIHIARIMPNNEDITALLERIRLANEKVNEILNIRQ